MSEILSRDYEKAVVFYLKTGKEIAVITNDLITTASSDIVVKLKPREMKTRKEESPCPG